MCASWDQEKLSILSCNTYLKVFPNLNRFSLKGCFLSHGWKIRRTNKRKVANATCVTKWDSFGKVPWASAFVDSLYEVKFAMLKRTIFFVWCTYFLSLKAQSLFCLLSTTITIWENMIDEIPQKPLLLTTLH